MLLLAVVASAERPVHANSDLRLQAVLEPALIGLDEEVQFQIFVHNLGGRGLATHKPIVDFELDNLEVVRGPERRRGDALRRQGLQSSLDAWVWHLRPQRVGKARVRKIRVRLGSRTFELPSQYIDVQVEAPPRAAGVSPRRTLPRATTPPPPSPPPPRSPPQVRLRATITPSQPYVGQQIRYRLYLDYQSNISGIRPRALPEFRGFWVHEMIVGQRPARSIEDGGERFSRAILLQRALFPLQSGELVLEAAEAQMNIKLPSAQTPDRPPGAPTEEQVRRRSNRLALQARELPPLPDEVDGVSIADLTAQGVLRSGQLGQTLVGEVDFSATLTPASVAAGTATTWTLTAVSNGHLQVLPAPTFTLPESFQQLPPEQRTEQKIENDVVWQTQRWGYVLVPEHEGTFTVPAVRLLYFDPESKAYHLATTDELQLVVDPANPLPKTTTGEEPTAETQTTGTQTTAEPQHLSRWWWPILAAVSIAFTLLSRREQIQTRLARRRQRRDQVEHLVHELTAAFRHRAARRAVSEAVVAWEHFLITRELLPKDTPQADWGRFLRHRKVQQATMAELEKLLDDIEYLRQVPKLTDVEAMVEELVQRSREIAELL